MSLAGIIIGIIGIFTSNLNECVCWYYRAIDSCGQWERQDWSWKVPC